MTNPMNWMRDTPGLMNVRLADLTLPATYCSASYSLGEAMVGPATPFYITDLWFNTSDAYDNILDKYSGWKRDALELFRAYKTHADRLELARRWLQAQTQDVLGQLTAGARYLDLDICHAHGVVGYPDGFYGRHGLIGPTLSALLDQIKTFLNRVAAELLVVQIRGFGGFDDDGAYHPECIALIKSCLGSYLYPRDPNRDPLRERTLGEILEAGPRVIILYDDPYVRDNPGDWSIWYNDQLFLGAGSAGARHDQGSMEETNAKDLSSTGDTFRPLSGVQWNLTPTEDDVGRSALILIAGKPMTNQKSDPAKLLLAIELSDTDIYDKGWGLRRTNGNVNSYLETFWDRHQDDGVAVNVALAAFYNDVSTLEQCQRISAAGSWLDPTLLGMSLDFDGAQELVLLPENQSDFGGGLTIEAWICCDSLRDNARILELADLEHRDDITFTIRQKCLTLEIAHHGARAIFTAPGTVQAGEWTHVAAIVYPNSTCVLMRAGLASAPAPMNVPRMLLRRANYLGNSTTSSPRFDGGMCEVRLWTRPRTPDEIRADMYRRLTGTEKGLWGYWRLNDRRGHTVRDATPARRHATLRNGLYRSGPLGPEIAYGSLAASNYPTNYVRPQNGALKIAPVQSDTERREATLRIVTGLADPSMVSLQYGSDPELYMRHQYARVHFHRVAGEPLYKADATFRLVPGLDGGATVSFESYNFPGSFIRHRNGDLYCEGLDGSPLSKADASFVLTAPLQPTKTLVSLSGWKDPGGAYKDYSQSLIHCRSELGYFSRLRGTRYQKDAVFKIVPGLADPSLMSFESLSRPGWYLRYNELNDVVLAAWINDTAFAQSATFRKEPDGGVSRSGTFSVEALYHPKDSQYPAVRFFICHKDRGPLSIDSPMYPSMGDTSLSSYCYVPVPPVFPPAPPPAAGGGAIPTRSVSFNGTDGRVIIPHHRGLEQMRSLTLEARVFVRRFRQWDGIITKGTTASPWAMQLWDNGALRFTANWGTLEGASGGGSWNSKGALTPNAWHHVAITYHSQWKLLKLYLDGQLDTEVGVDLQFGETSEDLILGADLPGGDEYLDGMLKEVRIFRRARMADEIAADMNRQISGAALGLVGYYRLDEGLGTKARDASVNEADGTLLHGATWIDQ